jgi:methanogenic corrinoid protein MtbC1
VTLTVRYTVREKEMKSSDSAKLSALIVDLKEKLVLREVERRLKKGEDPLAIVQECQEGMRLVGERYEQRVYYISGLIMAGEIMHRVGDMIFPLLKSRVSGTESGTILIGTVQGDIHYIGKDIATTLLRCFGFTVIDIGVNVPPQLFLTKAKEITPAIVGLSCLIHSCYEATRTTIGLLRTLGRKGGHEPALIVGGLVNQEVCDYVGADAWANDAMTGVRLCQQFVRNDSGSVPLT